MEALESFYKDENILADIYMYLLDIVHDIDFINSLSGWFEKHNRCVLCGIVKCKDNEFLYCPECDCGELSYEIKKNII